MEALSKLDRIIHIVIFMEIRSFGLGWDPLAGIVRKSPALSILCYDTFFDAKNLSVRKFGSMGAVGAGFWHFAAEKHGKNSFVCFSTGYYT